MVRSRQMVHAAPESEQAETLEMVQGTAHTGDHKGCYTAGTAEVACKDASLGAALPHTRSTCIASQGGLEDTQKQGAGAEQNVEREPERARWGEAGESQANDEQVYAGLTSFCSRCADRTLHIVVQPTSTLYKSSQICSRIFGNTLQDRRVQLLMPETEMKQGHQRP